MLQQILQGVQMPPSYGADPNPPPSYMPDQGTGPMPMDSQPQPSYGDPGTGPGGIVGQLIAHLPQAMADLSKHSQEAADRKAKSIEDLTVPHRRALSAVHLGLGLLGALLSKSNTNPGAGFIQGAQGELDRQNEDAQARYQQELQRRREAAAIAQQQADRQARTGQTYYQNTQAARAQAAQDAQQRYQNQFGEKELQQRAQLTREGYTSKEAIAAAAAKAKSDVASAKIKASLGQNATNAETRLLVKWADADPDTKALYYQQLLKLNPEKWSTVDADSIDAAIKSTPAAQKLINEKITTESKNRERITAEIARMGVQNKLDKATMDLITQRVANYPADQQLKAIGVLGNLASRTRGLDIADQRAALDYENKTVDNDRAALLDAAKLEDSTIASILKAHGGTPPDVDAEDYNNYQLAIQRRNKAKQKLGSLATAPKSGYRPTASDPQAIVDAAKGYVGGGKITAAALPPGLTIGASAPLSARQMTGSKLGTGTVNGAPTPGRTAVATKKASPLAGLEPKTPAQKTFYSQAQAALAAGASPEKVAEMLRKKYGMK